MLAQLFSSTSVLVFISHPDKNDMGMRKQQRTYDWMNLGNESAAINPNKT